MSTATLRRIYFEGRKKYFVDWYGDEISLRFEHLDRLLSECKTEGLFTSIEISGKITRKQIKDMIDEGANEFVISIENYSALKILQERGCSAGRDHFCVTATGKFSPCSLLSDEDNGRIADYWEKSSALEKFRAMEENRLIEQSEEDRESARLARDINLAYYPPYKSSNENTLSLSIPLYSGGQLEGERKSARYGLNLADLNLENTRQEVKYQTLLIYYQVLQACNRPAR